MRIHRRLTGGMLTLLLIIQGCSAPDEEAPDYTAAGMVQPVPDGVLERLRSRYPVLGESPAPEPQPNGSAAAEMPARMTQALPEEVLEQISGEATYYADHFEGRRTASGIPFRQNQMVAAHRDYPFGTLLRVTNTRNNRSVNVRVVDRGPFGSSAEARRTVLDLSRRAATQLGYTNAGRTSVRVEVLEWGEGLPGS